MLANILKKNNVDNSGMRYDVNARTALAFVTLRADGEREFMFFRNLSADMLLTEAELDTNLIKKASIFHYGSISLIEEPCRSTHLAALKVAKAAGCILSYDPNLRLPLWPSAEAARKGIMSIWDQADLIKDFNGRPAVDHLLDDIFQHGDAVKKYMQGSRCMKIDNWILLDNFVQKSGVSATVRLRNLHTHSKSLKKRMSMTQHKKCGSLHLLPEFHNIS